MSDNNPINRALGLGPMPSNQLTPILQKIHDDSAKEDFTFARANIRDVIENASDAIAKLSIIADQSQNPRAFEVLAKLMDSVVDASDRLLKIQKDIKDMEKPSEPTSEEGKKIVNNNLFVGSTSELAKVIADMSKKDSG